MTWLAVVAIIVLLLVLCDHDFQLTVQHWNELAALEARVVALELGILEHCTDLPYYRGLRHAPQSTEGL